MAPFYEADVLFRIMDKRSEKVQMAKVFYIEYLRLLNHYGVLDKDQERQWKTVIKKQQVSVTMNRKDATAEDIKEAQEMIAELNASRQSAEQNRETKIAEFKLKKVINTAMDELKNYRDEDMKREFYMLQIKRSVMISFESLRTIEFELEMLKHQAGLTPEQKAANDLRSKPPAPGSLPPLQMHTITKESLNKTPYLMRPATMPFGEQGVVSEYQDPNHRVEIH